MNFTIENLSSVKKKINFEIPADRVAAEFEKVYEQVAKVASLKGFRKGKVPRSVVEKHFSDRIGDEVLRNLIGETCYRTMQENRIAPIGVPEIESGDLVKGEALTYSATVEVVPEIDLKKYKGLAVKREAFHADPGVIDERLSKMQENMAQLKPAPEGKAGDNGDFVTMDFTGYVDGVPFENGAAEDFQLEIGSGRFIPGFEEQVIGMKAGEERKITVTFPQEYGKEDLAGKDAAFDIRIKDIKAKELPAIDDDFAKECGDFETVQQLREKMSEVYEKQESDRIVSETRDRVVTALVESNPIEVPDAMVEKQLGYMLENARRRLALQKLSLEMMGMDEDRFRVQYRDTAVNQVKGMLLLDAVATKEGITVDDGDIESRYAEIGAENGQEAEKVKAHYQRNPEAVANLRMLLREDKAIGFLLGEAVIAEVPAKELQEG
jgi:trigger factor